MKLLFVHFGEKVKRDTEGNLYTDGSYSMKIWDRYLSLVDTITLIMREDKSVFSKDEASKRFNRIDSDRINFIPVSDAFDSISSFLNIREKKKRQQIVKSNLLLADAVIVRLPGAEWVANYANELHKPCVVEVVGCPFDSLWNHSWKGRILAIPAYFRLKRALRKATHAVYVTNEFLQKRYPTKGKWIGCSDVQITKRSEEDSYPQIEKKDILYLGTAAATDVKYKGQQYVIKALYLLKKKCTQRFMYQIAGNGSTEYLRSLVKKYQLEDSVEFMGSIPHEKMYQWYKKLDIYIQPSLQEGLPRALIEAMSAGVACIGSSAGGIPELLDKESVFPIGNVMHICETIQKFSNENYRKEKAIVCYQRSSEYSVDTLSEKRADFIRNAFVDIA